MRYSKSLLRELRNDIPVKWVITDYLRWPHKVREGIFRFLCPQCSDFHSAINSKTNLARCFRCQKNYNPIDLLTDGAGIEFKQAVNILEPLLTVFKNGKK